MGPEEAPRELIYLPAGAAVTSDVLLRLRSDARGRLADIAALVRHAVPNPDAVVLTDVAQQRDRLLDAQRARATLLGLLGIISFALGLAGIFALAGETVQRRLRDAAVRIALGASAAGVARQLVAHVAFVAFAGLLVGLAAGAAGAQWAHRLFYGVQASDPLTMLGVAAAVAGSAALAALLPARRAARVNVVALLKDE
jgi:putative ABC transport system permease protein